MAAQHLSWTGGSEGVLRWQVCWWQVLWRHTSGEEPLALVTVDLEGGENGHGDMTTWIHGDMETLSPSMAEPHQRIHSLTRFQWHCVSSSPPPQERQQEQQEGGVGEEGRSAQHSAWGQSLVPAQPQ